MHIMLVCRQLRRQKEFTGRYHRKKTETVRRTKETEGTKGGLDNRGDGSADRRQAGTQGWHTGR